MFTKKTVRDIVLQGKTVLLRADYNVPVTDKGEITDGYRITQSLQTIKYLQSQKCKIVLPWRSISLTVFLVNITVL